MNTLDRRRGPRRHRPCRRCRKVIAHYPGGKPYRHACRTGVKR